MRIPLAEHAVDEPLVRALVAEQHPDLAPRRIEFLSEGFDNTLWRLDDDLVARLPRRELSAALVDGEVRWLPTLARSLPLPIPAPVREGVPGLGYPWRWTVVAYLEGAVALRASPACRADQAGVLAAFLRALHHRAPDDAPRNPYRGVALAERHGSFESGLAELAGRVDVDAARRTFDAALGAAAFDGGAVWIHGDLHPDNLLLVDGRLAGVLDFGDLTSGDPATDLASAWMLFGASSVGAVLDAYGGVDEALLARARGWAVLFGLLLGSVGLDGRPDYVRCGLETLRCVAATTSDRPEPA